MEIRNVLEKNLPEIKEIADSLLVSPETKNKEYGFYDYSLLLEQYRARMKSKHFLVAIKNSRLEGFCMAYDSDFIRQLVEQEPQLKNDAIFKYITAQQEDYVYIDQLAVRKPKTFIGRTYACKLFERLKEVSKGKQFIQGVIPHIPWKNESSISFFTHQGARLIKEIKGKKNIVFGIYRLDLV